MANIHDQQQEGSDDDRLSLNCSICYSQPPVNAVQLNCGHIFCYLCIKSTSETTGRCALCRCEIGIEFNFQEHNILGAIKVPTSDDGFYWFYEGYRGWWLYDADTNAKIEQAYQRGDHTITEFIAGSSYLIDFRNMHQRRQDEDGRIRKICRATLELDNILGMSGLKGQDFNEILDMMRRANINS